MKINKGFEINWKVFSMDILITRRFQFHFLQKRLTKWTSTTTTTLLQTFAFILPIYIQQHSTSSHSSSSIASFNIF